MKRTAMVWLLLVWSATGAAAKTGSVEGTVRDASSAVTLPYASVSIEGTRRTALADEDGAFYLANLAPGRHTLRVSYTGYADETIDVTVTASASAKVAVSLRPAVRLTDETVVYGEALRGQAVALQKQRTAQNIRNVVSEELFNRFPDRNAAETVRRLPGVSVDRDQGEAEFVQIRGIDQEYNSLTLNGVRIPAPDGDDGLRTVGLDLVNNKILGEIEVIKAVTPDMDHDAVGGVVNFGLRRAPEGGLGRVSAGFGLNDQRSDFTTYGRGIQDFSTVLGQRFDDGRFGVLVDGALYRTNRQSVLKELEFTDDDGVFDEEIFAQHTNDYDVRRTRFGAGLHLDYQADPRNLLFASFSRHVYLDDEIRRIAEYIVDDEEETRETRNRLEDQDLNLIQAGGNHDLGALRIGYKGSWIKASEDMPNRTYFRFQRDNPFAGLTNDQIKELDGTSRFPDLDPLTLNRVRYDDRLKEDEDLAGQLDLTFPFQLGSGESSVKVGAKHVHKTLSWITARFQMTDFNGGAPTLGEGTFGFESVVWDDPEWQPFVTEWGSPRDLETDFTATEDVTAAYGMATLALTSKLTLLGGARYERTSNDYTQLHPETQETPLEGSGGYSDVMPSLHLTFRPDDRNVLRAAWTNGLARARYWDLVPRRVVDEDERTIFYGNPALEPRTAWSLDLMYERYSSRLGFLSAGVFYKNFDAFHTRRIFTELIDGVPYEATQTVMGDGEARYAGLEVSLQQKLGAIAPALDDFSIFGNYNYTWSEAGVDGRDVPLTNSPKHIVNLSLLYDNYQAGLSFVVALNYRDALLTGVGDNPFRDQYFDSEVHLDLAATMRLTDRLKVVAAVNGLTARREEEVLGDPSSGNSRLLQYEEYGPYATVALQCGLW